MRFGVCCGLGEAPLVLACGFDYVEMAASEIAVAPSLELYRDLPVEATNVFFPSSVQLFGSEPDAYKDYARTAIDKVASLGVRVIVIGSGSARNAPQPSEDAEHRFASVAAYVGGVAKAYGIAVAPESLNRSETNVGNDLGALAKRLHAEGVGYTIDLYHILFEAEANQVRPDYRTEMPFLPTHVHLGDRPRNVPSADDPELLGFAARLRELGYDARISLECSRPNPAEDLPKALRMLREVFA